MSLNVKSLDELVALRNKFEEDYEGELPSYLKELLDLKERYLKIGASDDPVAEIRDLYVKDYESEFDVDVDKGFRPNDVNILSKEERSLTPQEVSALVSVCSKDIYLFAIRYFPHYLRLPPSKIHRYIYGLLSRTLGGQSKIKKRESVKYAIAAPRKSAKSSILLTILPLWCICYNKKKFIIMVSNTSSQACDFLSDVVREIDNNALLRRDFPHICGKGEKSRNEDIVTPNGIRLIALGTGNQIRGRKFGIYRPDLILMDDIETSDMVRSKSQREFIQDEWFEKDVLYTAGDDETVTDFFMVGTVLGKLSLLNRILTPGVFPAWQTMRFQAVESFADRRDLWDKWAELYSDHFDIKRERTAWNFYKEHEEEMLEGAKVSWPEGHPYYKLMISYYFSPTAFQSEMQNNPIDLSKVLVKESDIRTENFPSSPRIQEILRNPKTSYYGGLDPSLGKKSDTGDYSVICTIARDAVTGVLLVLDFSVERRSVNKQIDDILALHTKYNYRMFLVETNAFQYVLAEQLRKKSMEEGIYVPIKDVNQYQDKKMRFEGLAPFIKDGTIIFNSEHIKKNKQYANALDQITTVTGEGDEVDDAFDALDLAFKAAKKAKFRMIAKPNRS